MLTDTFIVRQPATLFRIADFLENGGPPLADWERRIARRALELADGDADDASAILCIGAERIA